MIRLVPRSPEFAFAANLPGINLQSRTLGRAGGGTGVTDIREAMFRLIGGLFGESLSRNAAEAIAQQRRQAGGASARAPSLRLGRLAEVRRRP